MSVRRNGATRIIIWEYHVFFRFLLFRATNLSQTLIFLHVFRSCHRDLTFFFSSSSIFSFTTWVFWYSFPVIFEASSLRSRYWRISFKTEEEVSHYYLCYHRLETTNFYLFMIEKLFLKKKKKEYYDLWIDFQPILDPILLFCELS